MNILESAFGQGPLERFPKAVDPSLRAWDAADEYLLEHTASLALSPDACIWVVNDQFGALSVHLSQFNLYGFSDSWLSHTATERNLKHFEPTSEASTAEPSDVQLHSSLVLGDAALPKPDLVLVKLPKSLAMLEDQLARLHACLDQNVPVVFAGMVKHMSRNIWPTIEQNLGSTETSLAKKKAKLIFAHANAEQCPAQGRYPSQYQVPEFGLNLSNHAGVFSRDSLDIGTRFLLQNLKLLKANNSSNSPANNPSNIVDLACGNGVIGLSLAKQYPEAKITFTDESFMAAASAELNAQTALGDVSQHQFLVNHSLSGLAPNSQDLVVVNPPFHQQNTVSDQVARAMFKQSARCLNNGGELWVVANRHLGYHKPLKALFGHCEVVTSNKKFVILRAQKNQ